MSFFYKSNILKKFVGIGLILSILSLSAPQKTSAQFVVEAPLTDTLLGTIDASIIAEGAAVVAAIAAAEVSDKTAKGIELSLNGIAWYAAKLIIKKLTASTVNWINSGFKGNPAYVTDPGQFFLDTADGVASKVLSDTSLNKICSPFKASVRLALVKNYISENENYSCSLRTLKNNYDAFTDDFSQGGWDGWFEVTQNTQNNPFGSYFSARNKLSADIGAQQTKYQKQLEWGQGFLSFEKCKSRQVGPTETTGLLPSTSLTQGIGSQAPVVNPGDCLEKETVTPGSVINDQLKKVVGSGVDALNAADSINEIFGALVDQLFSKMINGANGLRGVDPKFPDTKRPKAPNSLPKGVEAADGTDYNIAAAGGQCGSPLAIPEGTAANMISVVQGVAQQFPEYLRNSCQDLGGNWNFMDEVVNRLHAQDPNWGYNGKRGDFGNLSLDAISYKTGDDLRVVYIIDIIAGHCGTNPQPAWQDVTTESYSCGAPGAYVYPRGGSTGRTNTTTTTTPTNVNTDPNQ